MNVTVAMTNNDDIRNATVRLHYQLEMGKIIESLESKHGRKSDLAKFLGVSRQTINRWFIAQTEWVPGWALIGAEEWRLEILRHGPEAVPGYNAAIIRGDHHVRV